MWGWQLQTGSHTSHTGTIHANAIHAIHAIHANAIHAIHAIHAVGTAPRPVVDAITHIRLRIDGRRPTTAHPNRGRGGSRKHARLGERHAIFDRRRRHRRQRFGACAA